MNIAPVSHVDQTTLTQRSVLAQEVAALQAGMNIASTSLTDSERYGRAIRLRLEALIDADDVVFGGAA